MAERGGARGGGRGGGGDDLHRRGDARKGFLLRLPPRMLAELRSWAAQDLRSLNAQIEFLLAEALRRRKGGK